MIANEQPKSLDFPTHRQALIVVVITMFVLFFIGLVATGFGIDRNHLLLAEALTIVPALIFVVQGRFNLKIIFRLRPVNLNIIVASVFIGLALTILTDEVDRLVQMIIPMPEFFLKELNDMLVIQSTSDLIIIVTSAVFLAAICEESLFRGFLQTSFEQTFDVTKAIMLTALIFAIFHFIPWWTIQLILFAIFLGVLAWKSNSIFPSFIVHLINNGIALLFSNIDESYFKWYFLKNHVNPTIILIAGFTLFFGLKKFYQYCDEYHEQQSSYPSSANHSYWNHSIDQ